ncbi:MAG: large subunit ribosomal protein L24 [Verrucomicrobia bacterium]|jgi:large subunit ribosomal protein L24|nr:MAG: large subunit ribosomal protein L24 [Verrucomicrobiota bacterium]
MATKFHVKRGDVVVVIAGSHKGKTGKILEILAAKQRARIEGVAMIKRHLKKSQEHPQGTIAEREGSVHISNLMLQAAFDASKRKKPTAVAATA